MLSETCFLPSADTNEFNPFFPLIVIIPLLQLGLLTRAVH